MKKKILSIALVLGMLLSLLSSVPVSADAASNRSLSYAFFDYEDGAANLQDATIVDGGMAGSAKSLKYTSTATATADKTLYLGGSNEAVEGTVPAGATLNVSFFVKLSRNLTSGDIVLKLSTGDNLTASVTATNTTDWQKVSFSKKFDAETAITSMKLNFGANVASYYIDDMEISISSPYNVVPGSAPMTFNDYTMDFENGSSVIFNGTHITAEGVSSGSDAKGQLIADPTNPSNTVMSIWLASNVDGEGYKNGRSEVMALRFAESTVSTTLPTGTIAPGETLRLTFRYYLPQEMESSNKPTFAWLYRHGASSTGHLVPVNDPYYNRETTPATTANQWHTVEFKWTNNGTSDRVIGSAYNNFRIQASSNYHYPAYPKSWVLPGHTSSTASSYNFGDRYMYFDDFRFTIGSESAGAEPGISLDDYEADFETASTIQVGGANVTAEEAGSANETAQIAADPADATNSALKLTLAAGTLGNASTMKFSDSAEATTLASGKIPAGGSITYNFKYYLAQEMAANNPAFSVLHDTGAVLATSAVPFDTTAGEWHNATLTYTNTTLNELEVGGATLRYCGEENGTDWAAAEGAAVIYFDDFEVVTAGPKFASSSALTFTGTFKKGQNVVFSHTFAPSEEGAADKSLVRLVAILDGTKASLGSCAIGETFTVPVLPTGADLSFEVVPVDTASGAGTTVVYPFADVVGGFGATIDSLTFSPEGAVTAAVTVENERVDQATIKAILIVLMYDADGAVIGYNTKPIVCAYNTTITGTDGECTVAANASAASAEAFVWYCEGDTPSLANTTMEQFAPSVSATR